MVKVVCQQCLWWGSGSLEGCIEQAYTHLQGSRGKCYSVIVFVDSSKFYRMVRRDGEVAILIGKFVTGVRSEVISFAHDMEYKLQVNDHKEHWLKQDVPSLLSGLKREVEELEEAVKNTLERKNENWVDDVMSEAADVANYAMMLWDWFRNMP